MFANGLKGTNYQSCTNSKTLLINKADATVTVTGYTGTYDNAAHGATGTVTGIGGVRSSAGLDLGESFTEVPGGTAYWTFNGGTNYQDENGNVAIVITPPPGDIRVETIPIQNADVTIDNTLIGKTNDTFTSFTPGQHSVNVTLAGYKDVERQVTIKSGQTITEQFTLVPNGLIPNVNQQEAVDAVIKDILGSSTEGIILTVSTFEVAKGTSADTWNQKITSPDYGTWLVLIDYEPEASGWEHKIELVFVYDNGVYVRIRARHHQQ